LNLQLKGKVAIVTGGARGIGAGICEVLAEEGVNLVVDYRSDPEECEAFAENLGKTHGVKTIAVQADISVESEVNKLYGRAFEAFGGVDLLVNNAGVMGRSPIESMPLSEWNRFIATNLTGMFMMCQAFIRHCLEQKKGGRCVNVLSKSAISTNSTHNTHYVTTKGGALALTKGLANEMTKNGIYFNAIVPGYVQSHGTAHGKGTSPEAERKRLLIPTQTVAQPKEMGYITAFLLSPLASQMAGAIVDVTGGLLL
jgi:NAD(P)-dependent dehydrogenase (short-subunit alcohol dehydrogenase family)